MMRKGGLRKLAELLALFLSGGIEFATNYIELGINLPILGAVSAYICLMELISVLENLCAVSPTLYKLFKPYLAKLKEDYKHDEGD